MCPPTDTNTETTMSPAEALDTMRRSHNSAQSFADEYPGSVVLVTHAEDTKRAMAAVAALIEREAAAMEIVRRLAQLRDGLDNSNSSAEEIAARLAGKAQDLIARAEARKPEGGAP